MDRELDEESVGSGIALRPNSALVYAYNGFRNGKTQTVTAIHCPGLVCPVKPLENIFEFFFG